MRSFAFAWRLTLSLLVIDDYHLGRDSQRQRGVAERIVRQVECTNGKGFPGTTRDYWVYVPKQYDGSTPACLMVFQDGGGFVKADGAVRVPGVFDNLIHRKEMPVTVGVFVNPGVIPSAEPGKEPKKNRSWESYSKLRFFFGQGTEEKPQLGIRLPGRRLRAFSHRRITP